MKKIYLFYLLLLLNSLISVTRHIKNGANECEMQSEIKGCQNSHKINYPSIAEINESKENFVLYNDYQVDKMLLYFVNIYPITYLEFFTYIFNTYALEQKKIELIRDFYKMSPDDLWNILSNPNYFSCDFIQMINVTYEKHVFIAICKARMALELLIFAFNIKERTTEFPYLYCKDMDLKRLLHILFDFITLEAPLLEAHITVNQINDFKKFLHKYMHQKSINRISFISELKGFRHLISAFYDTKKNQENLSLIAQFQMVERFFKVIKSC